MRRPGSPSAGADDASTPGAPAACPCPQMDIEVNRTVFDPNVPATTADDDLVPFKCAHPGGALAISCRIRARPGASGSSAVVLTNPDGRLRFPSSGDTTRTLSVPADGTWVPFQITGNRGSVAIGDAVIQAHCNTATGPIIATKRVTVFWFDLLAIRLRPGGKYQRVGGNYTNPAGPTIRHSAQARIRPQGVNCAAPRVRDIRVGIMQLVRAALTRRAFYTAPSIAWNVGVANGTSVTIPSSYRFSINRPVDANDSEAHVAPLYDRPGQGVNTIDANSLMPPLGCAGGGSATSSDTPSFRDLPTTYTRPAQDAAGVALGTVTYTLNQMLIDLDFLAWVVTFNTVTQTFCALAEREWHLHADSSAAADQVATTGNQRAPTQDPSTAPFSNDVIRNAANHATVPTPAAPNVTITSPAVTP